MIERLTAPVVLALMDRVIDGVLLEDVGERAYGVAPDRLLQHVLQDLPQPDHPVFAGRLGVEAMILTRHVGNLKALVDGSVYPVLEPSVLVAWSCQLSDCRSSHSHQQLSRPALKLGIVVVA